MLDEAAILSVTKGKKTLKANVMFCIFLGGVFILVGLAPLLFTRAAWPLTLFLTVMGSAFIAGGFIYAKALREKPNTSSEPEARDS